jgi:AraC family transcriptional regulator
MITKEFGVHVAAPSRQKWPGLARIILNMRWETEPGWIALTFECPVLCVVLSETGGRCQTRRQPEQPAQGDYFGTGHLTFVAPSQPLTIYATEMRDARIALYQLDLDKTDCLSSEQAAMIARFESRYMLRDDRLYECARLLGEHEVTNDPDIYGLSLVRALQLALLGMPLRRVKSRTSVKLTGERFAEVVAYISDHLDQSTAVKDLALISNLSPAQFGRSFQDATGMSLQRWQMDARIRSAQRLMVDDPAESLSAIASLVGFSDSSHFSRAFLEIVGTTPSAWLRQRT